MSTKATALAHQFDTPEQQHEANVLGMWLFLATEVLFFGGLFAAYCVYRHRFPEAFVAGSEHLNVTMGTINTAVLLTSSLTMALAVRAAQTNGRLTALFLAVTIGLGLAFLGIKAAEWTHDYELGMIPGWLWNPDRWHEISVAPQEAQMFFVVYFCMTGLHALHMIIGIGILAILAIYAARGRFTPAHFAPVEIAGLYWHFVDIVWIFLFPLLYLIRH